MREFHLSAILFLSCAFRLSAQVVPFEGLRLDELLTAPGDWKPGMPAVQYPSLKVRMEDLLGRKPTVLYPGSPTSLFDKSLRTRMAFPVLTVPKYRLTDKLSFRLSTNEVDDGNRSLRHLYTVGVGGEFSYRLSRRFEWKSGVSYQYNIALKRWECTYQTGVVFHF